MKRFRTMSIRKKILISMLAFTLIPVTLVTLVATRVTYKTMRDQLIYDRRMSSSWLENRLSLELNETLDQFYQFEVDKELKAAIQNWHCLLYTSPFDGLELLLITHHHFDHFAADKTAEFLRHSPKAAVVSNSKVINKIKAELGEGGEYNLIPVELPLFSSCLLYTSRCV